MAKRRSWPRVQIGDNSQIDAFGKLRVSNPYSQFDFLNEYTTGTYVWTEDTTGGGTITHLPDESSVEMSTGDGSDGSEVIRQTKDYFRYYPGKSIQILMTAKFADHLPNLSQLIGYGDDENGLFFTLNNDGFSVLLRSSVTGSVVDTYYNQDDFNIDNLDGTGFSGVTVDITKAQIFGIDLEWLGVGRVRFFLNVDGENVIFHELYNANSLASVYMTTACLPLRYQITNDGAVSALSKMKQICSTVISEGNNLENDQYYKFNVDTGTSLVGVTTRRPVLSIRKKETFKGKTNRALLVPSEIGVYADGNPCKFEIVYGGTISGGVPTISSVHDDSITEYNTDNDTITGGIVIASGYVTASVGLNRMFISKEIVSRYSLGLDISGSNAPWLSIVITSLSGTSNIGATISLKEQY